MSKYFVYTSELESVATAIRNKLSTLGLENPGTLQFPTDYITQIRNIKLPVSEDYISKVFPLTDISANDPVVIYEKDTPTLEQIQEITANDNCGVFQIKWNPDKTKVAVILRPETYASTPAIPRSWNTPGIYIYDVTTRPFTLCTREVLGTYNGGQSSTYDMFAPASGQPSERPLACAWFDTGELLILAATHGNLGQQDVWTSVGTYGSILLRCTQVGYQWTMQQMYYSLGATYDPLAVTSGYPAIPVFFELAHTQNISSAYSVLLMAANQLNNNSATHTDHVDQFVGAFFFGDNTMYASDVVDLTSKFKDQFATCASLNEFSASMTNGASDIWAVIGRKADTGGTNFPSVTCWNFGPASSTQNPGSFNLYGFTNYTGYWTQFGAAFQADVSSISWSDNGFYLAVGHTPKSINSYRQTSVYYTNWDEGHPTANGCTLLNAPTNYSYTSLFNAPTGACTDLVSWRPRGQELTSESYPLDLIIHTQEVSTINGMYYISGKNTCDVIRYKCAGTSTTSEKIAEFKISSDTHLDQGEDLYKWSPKTIGWATAWNTNNAQVQLGYGEGLEFFIPSCDTSYPGNPTISCLSLYAWPLGVPSVAKVSRETPTVSQPNPQYKLFTGSKGYIGLGVATDNLTRYPIVTSFYPLPNNKVLKLASSSLPSVNDVIGWQNCSYGAIWYDDYYKGTITGFLNPSLPYLATVRRSNNTTTTVDLKNTPYFKESPNYTVNFYNGDNLLQSQTNIVEGSTISYSGNEIPSYYDHDFKNQYYYTHTGWSTDPNATTPMYSQNESFAVFDSMTLYAVKSVTTTALTYAINQFPNMAAPVPYADMYIKKMTDPDSSSYWKNVTSTTATTSTILTNLSYNSYISWKTIAKTGYYPDNNITSAIFQLNENTVTEDAYLSGTPTLYVKVKISGISVPVYSRIGGLYYPTSAGHPLPECVDTLYCYRKKWSGGNFVGITSGAVIEYGDQFYWMATPTGEYTSVSCDYSGTATCYTWTPSTNSNLIATETATFTGNRTSIPITGSQVRSGNETVGYWTAYNSSSATPITSGWTVQALAGDSLVLENNYVQCLDRITGEISWERYLWANPSGNYDYTATIYRAKGYDNTTYIYPPDEFVINQSYSLELSVSKTPADMDVVFKLGKGVYQVKWRIGTGSYSTITNPNPTLSTIYSETKHIPYGSTIHMYAIPYTGYVLGSEIPSSAQSEATQIIFGDYTWIAYAYSTVERDINLFAVQYGKYTITTYPDTSGGQATTTERNLNEGYTLQACDDDSIQIAPGLSSIGNSITITCHRNDGGEGTGGDWLDRWTVTLNKISNTSQYSYSVGPTTVSPTVTDIFIVDGVDITITPSSSRTEVNYLISTTSGLINISDIAVTSNASSSPGLPQSGDWRSYSSSSSQMWTFTYNTYYRIFFALPDTEANNYFAKPNWTYIGTYNNKPYYEIQSGRITSNITLGSGSCALHPTTTGITAPIQPAEDGGETDFRHSLTCMIFTTWNASNYNPLATELTVIIQNTNNFDCFLLPKLETNGRAYYKYHNRTDGILVKKQSYYYETYSIPAGMTWNGLYDDQSLWEGILAKLRDDHSITFRFAPAFTMVDTYADLSTKISPEMTYSIDNDIYWQNITNAIPYMNCSLVTANNIAFVQVKTRNMPSTYENTYIYFIGEVYLKEDPTVPIVFTGNGNIERSSVLGNNTSSVLLSTGYAPSAIEYITIQTLSSYAYNENYCVIVPN